MRIVLDGMGGDNAPGAIVRGACQAVEELPSDIEIVITGDSDLIKKELKKCRYKGDNIFVEHTEDVITNEESPVRAIRRKKDSSIVKGFNLLKDGEADAFVSAGSTGALLAGSLMIVGKIDGIDRPTLATVYPVIGNKPSLLTDSGANAECRPEHLLEFAVMGSVYMESVLGRRNPTVGLVNNGVEKAKGTTLTKEAYKLLEASDLNFIGNIETRELQNGVCDIIVTDGFTGNAILKLSEGMGLMVLRELKSRLLANTRSKIGALFLGSELKKMKSEFDYKEYGGAPILGVNGVVLKMHGSSDALAVKQTIIKAVPYVSEGVPAKIDKYVKLKNKKGQQAEEQ